MERNTYHNGSVNQVYASDDGYWRMQWEQGVALALSRYLRNISSGNFCSSIDSVSELSRIKKTFKDPNVQANAIRYPDGYSK